MHPDGKQHDAAHEAAPHHSRVVAPEMSASQGAAYYRYKCRKNGCDQKDWSANENLIYSVWVFQWIGFE